jgi:hypothetical protein
MSEEDIDALKERLRSGQSIFRIRYGGCVDLIYLDVISPPGPLRSFQTFELSIEEAQDLRASLVAALFEREIAFKKKERRES